MVDNASDIIQALSGLRNDIRSDIREAITDSEKRVSDKIENLKQNFEEVVCVNNELKEKVKQQEEKIEKLEKIIRKKNIVIYNFKEEDEKNLCSRFVQFISNQLKVPLEYSEIDFINRMGKASEGKIRPIIEGLTTLNKEIMILRSKKFLMSSKIFISDDLTEVERQQRSEKLEVVKELKSKGEENVKLWYNKIYINGTLYDPENSKAENEKRKRQRSTERGTNTKENDNEQEQRLKQPRKTSLTRRAKKNSDSSSSSVKKGSEPKSTEEVEIENQEK